MVSFSIPTLYLSSTVSKKYCEVSIRNFFILYTIKNGRYKSCSLSDEVFNGLIFIYTGGIKKRRYLLVNLYNISPCVLLEF